MSKINDQLMVTIRCITYNHEPYIRQCLESFVMQKTNFRFEAIVHDDASTDKTADIIREYTEKYPDIIKPIYEIENQYSKHDGSLHRIMNEHTHGKYVALCEGDDYWTDPFKLQKQVDFLETNPEYSMCFHNAVIIFEDEKYSPRIFNSINKSREVFLDKIVSNWIIPTASIVYRKNILPMPEWAAQIYSGDQTLALMAYSQGKIWAFKEVMSIYRKNEGGVSTLLNEKYKTGFLFKEHIKLYEYYNQETNYRFNNIISPYILQLKRDYIFCNSKNRYGLLLTCILHPKIFFFKCKNRIQILFQRVELYLF